MTDKTITIEKIKETQTYINLGGKIPGDNVLNNNLQQGFLIKRNSRLRMTHALIVYNSTGTIPNTVTGKELSVVKEFIEAGMQIV